MRSLKLAVPDVIVLPVSVASKVTVPEVVNVPALLKFPPIVTPFEPHVNMPADTVRLLSASNASWSVHPPLELLPH